MVQNLFKGHGLVFFAFSKLYCQDMQKKVQREVQEEAGLVERRKGRSSLILAGHPSLLSGAGAPRGQQSCVPRAEAPALLYLIRGNTYLSEERWEMCS